MILLIFDNAFYIEDIMKLEFKLIIELEFVFLSRNFVL